MAQMSIDKFYFYCGGRDTTTVRVLAREMLPHFEEITGRQRPPVVGLPVRRNWATPGDVAAVVPAVFGAGLVVWFGACFVPAVIELARILG